MIWHPDRLARYSFGGGRIICLLHKNALKEMGFKMPDIPSSGSNSP